jgi:hypothetical protein
MNFSDELMKEGVKRCCSHLFERNMGQIKFIPIETSVAMRLTRGHPKLVGAGLSVTAIAIFLWRQRRNIAGLLGIGPYPAAEQTTLLRALQRSLINWTRCMYNENMYPLNSILEVKPMRSTDNGHARCGAVRDAARRLINSCVTSLGRVPHEISPAIQSDNDGTAEHQHYATADLHRAVESGDPSANSIIVAIDVDYYLDDPSRFLGFAIPGIYYTFNPVSVAGRDGDSTFRIKDNLVTYDVSGGGSWRHEVWDWCAFGEFVEAPANTRWYQKIFRVLGIRKFIHHKIHHARPFIDAPHRALVWTIPVASFWKFSWIKCDLRARVLKRVVYQDLNKPGWNNIINDSGSTATISFGREGEDAQTSLPKVRFDVLMGLTSAQSVTSRLVQMKVTDPETLAMVGQYFTGKALVANVAARVARPISQPTVHWPSTFEVDDAVTSARTYATRILTDSNMVPMIKRWETLSDSIDQRVTYVANDKRPTARIQNYANEFVKLVVPLAGDGVQYSLEEAAALLDKPTQVLAVKQIWETVDCEHRRLIEAFVKNEPTNKSPRIISSFADSRFLLKFSAFTLKFRDEVLHSEHNRHWFMPGSTPEQIAASVCDYVANIDEPIEGDFSNFDGTVSSWCQRHVMNAVMLRFFQTESSLELQSYTDMLISCPGRAKSFGFKYDPLVGVKSGSPTTCDLNTVLNAFMQYCAVRMTEPEANKEDCFRRIGIAFGDDSVFERRYQRNFVKVAEQLGMSLKIERYDQQKGLTFLARVFPDPYTTNTTFQDPLRTWRKLHITMRDPNVPLASAAVDRVEGYLVTDSLTPITSTFCEMVIRNYASTVESAKKREARKSCNREKPYWLTTGGAWPQAAEDIELMWNVISARVGIDLATLKQLDASLAGSNDVWSQLSIDREDENPYKNTLDEDGLPLGDVDLRLHQHARETLLSRAGGGAASNNATIRKVNNGSLGQFNRTRDRGSRPHRVHFNDQRDEQQGPKSHFSASVKANDKSVFPGSLNITERPRRNRRHDRPAGIDGERTSHEAHSESAGRSTINEPKRRRKTKADRVTK